MNSSPRPHSIGAIALLLLLPACGGRWRDLETQPTMSDRLAAPQLRACSDATGHRDGALPAVLGGSCLCTPTPSILDAHQSHGLLDGWSLERFQQLYTARGWVTDLDHRGCNNLCADGPHVVFGGRCLTTPTPGTANYERVHYAVEGRVTLEPLEPSSTGEGP